MTDYSIEHICFLVGTAVFLVVTCYAVSKMSPKWQNMMFIIAAILGSGGLFFRYALNSSFDSGVHIETLLIQTLQVCNFNFVLLPLMLIPKFELARQYSVFFSMFAASTTMFSIPQSLAGLAWYDITLLTFWFNHVFAIALPLWMMCAGCLRPQRKYIPWVTLCVILYFTAVYGITELLMYTKVLPEGSSFSYVHNPKGMPIITQLFALFGGVPYWHLLPLIPVLVGVFFLFSWPFSCTVYFYPNGATGKTRRVWTTRGFYFKLTNKSFARDGFTFVGWSDAPDGEVKYKPDETINIGKNSAMHFHAIWKIT